MSSSAFSRTRSSGTEARVVPGFVDPHLHLAAMAAARLSVDLASCARVDQVLARLRAAAAGLEPGRWLRGSGYRLHELGDAAGLDRDALDRAVPTVPTVIHEASGHEAVLNTPALEALGLAAAVEEPGVEVARGRPTGRIRNAERLLRRVPRADPTAFARALGEVGDELAAAGVTAVTDATHTNGAAQLEMLGRHAEAGALPQRLEAMVAVGEVEAVAAAGWRFGRRRGGVVPGHAKAVAEDLGREGLREAVAVAHARGFPVAVHVLDIEPLQDALEAIAAAPPCAHRDRIEHFSLSLPSQVERAAELGVTVVTQPGFLVERGAKYRTELSPPEQELLYRVGSLLAAGIAVAASSDAPTARPEPLRTIAAAVDRAGFDGEGGEAVTPAVALELVTSRAAAAGSGGAGAGDAEDLVVLSGEPGGAGAELPRVLATFRGGEPIYRAEGFDGRGRD